MTALALAVYALMLTGALVAVWRNPVLSLYAFVVGLAAHNAVMAALYGAGIRGSALSAIQAWKEILLAGAFARVALEAARVRRLPFRFTSVDVLALAFGALVCLYALVPQGWLDGAADRHSIGLALKHDLVPVAAYFLGRALNADARELARLGWTVVVSASVVAVLGLIDVYAVPIGWWRDSAAPDYFRDQLGYDYHGTGGLPENFIYNVGADEPFLRRLVSVFLSPLASAYITTVALLLAAALARRLQLLVAAAVVLASGLLFTFSRSSLIALAAGLVVLAFARRQVWPVLAAVGTIAISLAWVHVFPSIAPTGRFTQADLEYQHEQSEKHPGATFDPTSGNEPSIRNHLTSLRDGAGTVLGHPQGFGLGNAGQTASRTDTPIKAGESNYTELGVETGLAGSLLWIAWGGALLWGLLRDARRTGWWASAAVAAALSAALVLAVQTDVIGDPWMAYVLWGLAGLTLMPQRGAAPGVTCAGRRFGRA